MHKVNISSTNVHAHACSHKHLLNMKLYRCLPCNWVLVNNNTMNNNAAVLAIHVYVLKITLKHIILSM